MAIAQKKVLSDFPRPQTPFGNALTEVIPLPIWKGIQPARNGISRGTGGVPKCNLGTREASWFEELRFMRYAVIIEQGETSYGAYVPDLPGCVAVAETKDEVMSLIKDAIEFHLEGIKQEGQAVPIPSSVTEYIEVAA